MLSDMEIVKGMQTGDIIIEPYNEKQLNPNSYDVRLGEHFWVMNSNTQGPSLLFHRNSPEHDFHLVVFNPGEPFLLRPGSFVLGHTEEFIGSTKNYAPHIMTRSSPARCGIMTHLAAGFGDVGFANRWTLEIANLGTHTVPMYPGETIAQIAWSRTGPTERKYKGSYARRDEWTPKDMLPRWGLP